MATSNTIKKGAVGAEIQVTITKNGATWDLTAATVTAKILKPDGSTATWTMTLSNATAGVVKYTTISGDIDQAGMWKLEPRVVQGSIDLKADTVRFRVEEAL